MDTKQVLLVQNSFKKVLPIKETAAELFYGRLFETEPSTRVLFKGDMKEQGAKLMSTLAMVVTGLGSLETILPQVQQLATRHVSYGVQDQQYEGVGKALIWTLEQGLGEDFTDDVRDAWVVAYTALSGVMIEAAKVARAGDQATG